MPDVDRLLPGPYDNFAYDDVIVCDTETTGLHPYGLKENGQPTDDPHGPDRLCSIAMLRLSRRDGMWSVGEMRSWRFDPRRHVPAQVSKVNGFIWSGNGIFARAGYTDLLGLGSFASAVGEIMSFANGLPMIFHNAAFDVAVIDSELERAGLPLLTCPVACTKKGFSELIGLGRPDVYVPGTNLNALCNLLGIDRSCRNGPDGSELHGAEIDALLAAHCFEKLDARGWMPAEDPANLPHRIHTGSDIGFPHSRTVILG
jgi:DNA polymerase III epsilon subunit-like protein